MNNRAWDPSRPGGVALGSTLDIDFASGRDLLIAYWNSVGRGGVALPGRLPVPSGAPLTLRVRIGEKGPMRVGGRVAGVVTSTCKPPCTYVELTADQASRRLLEAAWNDAAPRRDVRRRVERPVAYGRGERPVHVGRTRDVSEGGVSIEGPYLYPAYTDVYLYFDQKPLRARVRWALPGRPARMGLAFEEAEPARAGEGLIRRWKIG